MTPEQTVAALYLILAKINARIPPADSTCDEPGILFVEAVRRELNNAGHNVPPVDVPSVRQALKTWKIVAEA